MIPDSGKSHQVSKGPFISVGTKLAATTMCLIALVAFGTYTGLSSYERKNLLNAKETAAMMVARLFNDSLSASLAFSDDKGVQDIVANLSKNEDLIYAGVWGMDAEEPTKLGARSAEFDRSKNTGLGKGPPIPKTIETVRSPGWVTLTLPVVDPTNKTLGVSQVAFSFAKENAAIAQIEHQVLMLSMSVALGLTFLLILVARFGIVRPLARLAHAARQLETGKTVEIRVGLNDEIGRLAHGFQAMSDAIQSREAVISAKNRDMRLVLDNVEEGFLTIDRDGNMSDERSRVLDTWFPIPSKGATFLEYLGLIDEKLRDWFQMSWDSVLEDVLPLELSIEQLPRQFVAGNRHFELRYRPIMDGETLSKMLVVLSDVTARHERELAERAQKEMLVIVRHVLTSRSAFEEFFAEASGIVETVVKSELGTDMRREIHTIKGNCAIYGLDSVAKHCHELETALAERDEPMSAAEKDALFVVWSGIEQMVAKLGKGDTSHRIELEESEHAAFLAALRVRTDYRTLARTALSWKYERAGGRLTRVAETIRALGQKLGKGEVHVDCLPTGLRIPPSKWAGFWSAFTHVVRNTVDHGLETPEERLDAGKPVHGRVTLSMDRAAGEIHLTISDDGRGIAWDRIAEKAKNAGLAYETRNDLEEALFADSISSRDVATEMSGRGVGMGAVREAAQELGGRIEISTAAGKGTTFRFVFPDTTLTDGERLSFYPPAMDAAS